EAAQRFDRARAELGRHHGVGFYAVGAALTSERGTQFDQYGAIGPMLDFGFGSALSSFGEVESSVGLRTLEEQNQGALTMLEQQGAVRFHVRPGPFAAELELAERAGL